MAIHVQHEGTDKFLAALADRMGCCVASVHNKHKSTMEKSLEKSNTIKITDFLTSRTKMYITQYSSILRNTSVLEIPDEVQKLANSLLNIETHTVETIKMSPNKTRVNLKGKIVKVSGKSTKTIRKTNRQLSFLNLHVKDATGVIPVSLWGKNADDHSGVVKGQSISITQGERATTNDKPVLNTWEDSTIVEILNEDLDISDEDIPDEENVPKANVLQGEMNSFGNCTSYASCQKERCYYKKLQDNICPTCKTPYETLSNGYIADVGITLTNGQDVTGKIFTQTLKKLYEQIRPSCPLPNAEQLESEIFNKLPSMCSFTISTGNVITNLKLL